jgi:hypothetical protein
MFPLNFQHVGFIYVNVDIIVLKLRTRMWLIGRSTSGSDPIILSLIPLAILPSSLSQRRMAQHPADTSRQGRNNEARNHPARKTIFVGGGGGGALLALPAQRQFPLLLSKRRYVEETDLLPRLKDPWLPSTPRLCLPILYSDRSLVGEEESGQDLLLLFLLGSQELAYFTTESSEAIAKKNSLSQV